MAAAFRILLWALVLIAPGGILLAPVLAAHELRRRNRAKNPAPRRPESLVAGVQHLAEPAPANSVSA